MESKKHSNIKKARKTGFRSKRPSILRRKRLKGRKKLSN